MKINLNKILNQEGGGGNDNEMKFRINSKKCTSTRSTHTIVKSLITYPHYGSSVNIFLAKNQFSGEKIIHYVNKSVFSAAVAKNEIYFVYY